MQGMKRTRHTFYLPVISKRITSSKWRIPLQARRSKSWMEHQQAIDTVSMGFGSVLLLGEINHSTPQSMIVVA